MADPIIELNGLQLANNDFSASPPGSLAIARGCVMPQKGVVEPARGQARGYVGSTADAIPWSLTEFQNAIIGSFAPNKDDDFTLGVAGNPTSPYSGTFNPVDRTGDGANFGKMKFGFAGLFAHFCTTLGAKTLEAAAGPPRNAGLLRMPDMQTLTLSPSIATPGYLPYGASVAYRSVLRKPTSDASLLSPPSGRSVLTNRILIPIGGLVRTGGTTVTVTVPGILAVSQVGIAVGDTFTLSPGEANFAAGTYTVATVSTNTFTYADVGANVASTVAEDIDVGTLAVRAVAYLSEDATVDTPVRFYRSKYTVSATVEPSDEMFLVVEIFPTSTDISNGYVVFDDTTPQSVINDPLYNNPQTGEGAKNSNDAPPMYRDLAFWKERMFYANTTGLETLRIQMLGVGAPDGVQNNDTITIDDNLNPPVTFTFKTAPAGPQDVRIYSDSTPSVNIQRTTQALILSMNVFLNAQNVDIRGYYDSAQDESPGKILLQRVSFPSDPVSVVFSVTVSRIESWTPAFVDASTPVDSSTERIPNALCYSKVGQAEAVPPLNYTAVGAKNYAIERIIGLQNALLVFKSGDGIYAVTGNFPFQILQISTANIIARDCCAQFADSVWVYTDQGILRVSDSGGATVVSRPIETELNRLRAEFPDQTRDYAFAVPYETERRIMFFVPFALRPDTPVTNQSGLPIMSAWCYSNATQAWTGPLYLNAFSGNVGIVGNRLALGIYDYTWATGRVTLERKSMDFTDNANASFANTIAAVNDNPLVVQLGSMTDVEKGDVLAQGDHATVIAALRDDLGADYVEVYEEIPWTVAACTIYKQLDYEAQLLPMGSPATRKSNARVAWLFKQGEYCNRDGQSTVMSDQTQAEVEIPSPSNGFGLGKFGEGPFGNPSPLVYDVNPIPASVANGGQFFVGIRVAEAFTKMKLQGVMLTTETASGPVGRGPR